MRAAYDLDEAGRVLRPKGDWTVWTVADLDAPLRAAQTRLAGDLTIDVAELGRLDMAGAWLLARTAQGGEVRGDHPAAERLITVARQAVASPVEVPAQPTGLQAIVERIGKGVVLIGAETMATLSFLGQTLAVCARLVRRPDRIRWTSAFAIAEQAGLNALPIIATLSFFVGVVVAYLGARVLSDFGASVFTVELVGFSVLREFAVVITAVLLAGRTDSAFTAEIGAMKMRQEIDAMRVLGLDVMERLVAPRVIAMVVMTPLLTFAAMVAGLAGGMLVCWGVLGVSPVLFLSRIQEGVGETHFWVGLSKAPLFGFVLALVGCRHGLRVGGDVASLGRETTSSVVQAIFLVVVIDAALALWFMEMGW
ncbi:MAG: ABC transporter permease [Alphaproteobacteria bacterium]|nr:ABC transporter permease [Alphaproteobacteria bacterium]